MEKYVVYWNGKPVKEKGKVIEFDTLQQARDYKNSIILDEYDVVDVRKRLVRRLK